MTGRANRRHHRARKRQKARRVLLDQGLDESAIQRLAPRLADNMQICSCDRCTWRRGVSRVSDMVAEISEREQTADPIGDVRDGWV